jgi:hypothetical protein
MSKEPCLNQEEASRGLLQLIVRIIKLTASEIWENYVSHTIKSRELKKQHIFGILALP